MGGRGRTSARRTGAGRGRLLRRTRGGWPTQPSGAQEEEAKLGLLGHAGEEGFSTLERRWYRPTVEVVGIGGGYVGVGMKNIVPSRATLKLLARIVPYQHTMRSAVCCAAHCTRLPRAAPTIDPSRAVFA